MPRGSRDGAQIRVLVRDTSHMGTQLFCEVLSKDRRFAPAAAHSMSDLVAESVDIVLIADSVQIDSYQGPSLIQEIRRRRPELPVVVLLEETGRSRVVDVVRAGARGVVCRSEPIKTLGKCISCVYGGQVWANQNELEYLLEALSDPVPIRLIDAKGTSLLSAREQDVVRWVADGLTNREIADRLGLSEHTIKNYLFRIFEKLGISNRMELILYVVSQMAPRRAVSARDGNSNGTIEANNAPAAYVLAERYRKGEGVPLDQVCAYMWFEVARSAATHMSQKAHAALSELAQSITEEQVAEGKRRAKEWLARDHASAKPQAEGSSVHHEKAS